MQWFNKYVAFTLLALWLPVTYHCDLEAAGVLATHGADAADNDCCQHAKACPRDLCEIVEGGAYRSASLVIKAVAPDLRVCAAFLFAHITSVTLRDDPPLPAVVWSDPLGWTPTWQFVRRAAPLSRAPAALG